MGRVQLEVVGLVLGLLPADQAVRWQGQLPNQESDRELHGAELLLQGLSQERRHTQAPLLRTIEGLFANTRTVRLLEWQSCQSLRQEPIKHPGRRVHLD